MKNEPIRDEFLEKRKARQRKAQRKRRIICLVAVIIVAVITLVILCLTVFFPIEKITTSGSKIYTNEEIVKASGINKGDNIFTFGADDAINSLKAKLPFIERVEFDRKFPDKLHIKVYDAKPYLCISLNGEYYNVSKEGWVLEKVENKVNNAFEIRLPGVKCEVGSQIIYTDEKSKKMLYKVIKLLEANSIKIDYIDVTNPVIIKAGVDGRFDVNFGTENLLENKVKHLKKTMETIAQNKSGSINLSMWNDQKPQSTFVEYHTK